MAGLDLNKNCGVSRSAGWLRASARVLLQHLIGPGEAGASDYRAGDDFGLFLSWLAYIISDFALDPIPDSELYGHKAPSNGDLLAAVDAELAQVNSVCVNGAVCDLRHLYAAQPFLPAEPV